MSNHNRDSPQRSPVRESGNGRRPSQSSSRIYIDRAYVDRTPHEAGVPPYNEGERIYVTTENDRHRPEIDPPQPSHPPRPPRYAWVRDRHSRRPSHVFQKQNSDDDVLENFGGDDQSEYERTLLSRRRSAGINRSWTGTGIEKNKSRTGTGTGKTRIARVHEDLRRQAIQPVDVDVEQSISLNHVSVCVFQSSKRIYKTCRVRMVKKGSTHRTGALSHEHLRDDEDFFRDLRKHYEQQLKGSYRRYITFKTVGRVGFIQFGDGVFNPANIPQKRVDRFSLIFMSIYNETEGPLDPENPRAWVSWLRKIRGSKIEKQKVDLAIEMIEEYNASRVMGAIAFVLGTMLLLTAVWMVRGGDPAYVCSVMSFVLALATGIAGLTALWDFLDLSHAASGRNTGVYRE